MPWQTLPKIEKTLIFQGFQGIKELIYDTFTTFEIIASHMITGANESELKQKTS